MTTINRGNKPDLNNLTTPHPANNDFLCSLNTLYSSQTTNTTLHLCRPGTQTGLSHPYTGSSCMLSSSSPWFPWSFQASIMDPDSGLRPLHCFSSCVVTSCSEYVYSRRARTTYFMSIPLWHLVLESAQQVRTGDCFSDVLHLRCQERRSVWHEPAWEGWQSCLPSLSILWCAIMTAGG